MSYGLTPKQRELLDYIGEYQLIEGVAPSFDEMMVAVGLKSKSGVTRLIVGLEERGHIERLPHRARAIKITSGNCPTCGHPRPHQNSLHVSGSKKLAANSRMSSRINHS